MKIFFKKKKKHLHQGKHHEQAKHRKPRFHRSRKRRMRAWMAWTPHSLLSPLFSVDQTWTSNYMQYYYYYYVIKKGKKEKKNILNDQTEQIIIIIIIMVRMFIIKIITLYFISE